MILSRGKRFLLKNQSEFAKIRKGKVEVYAVRENEGEWKQFFLTEIQTGYAVFPSCDEFEKVSIMIYALEDTELLILSQDADDCFDDELISLMQAWFYALSKMPYFGLFAAKGDDIIQKWALGDIFLDGAKSKEIIWQQFKENQSIASMLIGSKFNSEDVYFSNRLDTVEKYKEQFDSEAAANLTGENTIVYEGEYEYEKTVREAVFIVRCVAKALLLPVQNMRIGENKSLERFALLSRLMKNIGISYHAVSLEKDWHNSDCGVIIGYYGKSHELAAILPETPTNYRMITMKNPGGFPVTQEIADEVEKKAFVCYSGFSQGRLSIKDLLLFMFKSCWRADYRTIIAASFFGGLIPLLTPIVTETIFEDIIPINDRAGLATVTQVLMVTGFGSAAFALMRSLAALRINLKINLTAEIALWQRLLRLPTKFFREFQAGDILSRMNALASIKELITGEYVGGVFSVVFSVWSLVLMCWYSLWLTVAACVVWFVYFIFVVIIYRRVFFYERKLIEAGNNSAGQVQEIFSGLGKFRVHGAKTQAFYLWSKFFGEEWKWTQKLRWQGNKYAVLSVLQPFVLSMVLYYMAMYRMTDVINGVSQRSIDYPAFLAFTAAYAMMSSALVSMIPLAVKIFSLRPHIDNLRPILETEPEDIERKPDIEKLSGALEVRHLSFGYEAGSEVLSNVSFKVNAGEFVAIVGSSGCGKSTLLRLLLGFETPNSGTIMYDGQDMSEISVTSLRSLIGVVLQNGQLMAGDILSNIIGVSELTMDDAWEAAEACGIANDIRKMPMGMMTMIAEGSGNISGGQRQRILIARAIAKRPAILILDEATSALDNQTQSVVTQSLEKLNSTRIVVAHRLSTIKNADRIIVLDKGKIVESGVFDELMQKDGFFSRLAKRQIV